MRDTTKKKNNHADLRILATRDFHDERGQIEARLRAHEADIAELKAWVAEMRGVADAVSPICKARDAFHSYLDALGIEDILIEHVPLSQRWMLERWFSAIRATDEGIDELAGMVPDMEPHPVEAEGSGCTTEQSRADIHQ